MVSPSLRPTALCFPLVSLLIASSFGLACHAQSTFPFVQGSPYDFEICRSADLLSCVEQHALSPLTLDGTAETFMHDTAGEVQASEMVTHLGGNQYQLTISFQSPSGADLYPAGGNDAEGDPLMSAALGLGHLASPFQFQAAVRLDSAVLFAHSPVLPQLGFPNPLPIDATDLLRAPDFMRQLDPWDGTFPRSGGVFTASPAGNDVLGLNVNRVDAVFAVSVIPEPSTLVLLLVVGGLAVPSVRRRRQST